MRALLVAALGLTLLAGSARAAGPPVLGFSITSPHAGGSTAAVPLPSAATPNAPGSISVPVSFTSSPAIPEQLSTMSLHSLWQRASLAYGIPWQVLASINKIESNFGRNMGPSSAGAIGWMQFMPSTWLRWGVDADGDGVADPWNAADAIFAAARYLAAAGGQTDISRAVFAYNHADWYVSEVLGLAQVYGSGGLQQTVQLDRLQATLDDARARVVAANDVLVRALAREARIARESQRLLARVDAAQLLSDRLAAERRAGLFGAHVEAARAAVESARGRLQEAHAALDLAQQQAQAPSFSAGVGTLLAGASYQGNYVFPVGGGPQFVSVAHTHHDYPAADIAAPAGAPVYSLSDAVVLSAWRVPDPRCGIGMTIQTQDGQVWTYCHLAYLEPAVTDGAALTAGAPVGLVGSTGDATGPHLHLQLQPATSYPQEQAWFQSFAGTAFRWQDVPTLIVEPVTAAPAPAPERVFAVVPEPSIPRSSDALGFTRGGA